ncbi:hypothetical protein [Burkholderia plantarii]|uniref:hypothetical protein n=1 Tax=Burkholderia plantarii TaxID=41899 RepID=UPI000B143D45|nr:hypothetical protein [Burkholderia plantarii]
MSDDLEVTEQEELARFFAGKVIEQYREQYPDFDDGEDTVEALTQALLEEYRSGEPFEVTEPDTPPTTRGFVDFPIDFNFNLVVGSMDIHIENPDTNEYTILATFKIAGFKISSSLITLTNSRATRTETVGAGPVKITMTFSIDFSDGVELTLEGDGKIWPFKKFHIGPFNVNL